MIRITAEMLDAKGAPAAVLGHCYIWQNRERDWEYGYSLSDIDSGDRGGHGGVLVHDIPEVHDPRPQPWHRFMAEVLRDIDRHGLG